MTRLILLGLPLILGAWNLALAGITLGTVLASLAGVAAVVYGAEQHRSGFVTAGVFALLVAHAGALVTAGTPVQVWPGLAYGLGLLIIMEASYDHLTILRGRAAGRRYAVRRVYLMRVGVGTVIAGFVVAVLGVGFAPRLADQSAPAIFWVGGLSVVALSVAALMLLRFWLKERSSADTDSKGRNVVDFAGSAGPFAPRGVEGNTMRRTVPRRFAWLAAAALLLAVSGHAIAQDNPQQELLAAFYGPPDLTMLTYYSAGWTHLGFDQEYPNLLGQLGQRQDPNRNSFSHGWGALVTYGQFVAMLESSHAGTSSKHNSKSVELSTDDLSLQVGYAPIKLPAAIGFVTAGAGMQTVGLRGYPDAPGIFDAVVVGRDPAHSRSAPARWCSRPRPASSWRSFRPAIRGACTPASSPGSPTRPWNRSIGCSAAPACSTEPRLSRAEIRSSRPGRSASACLSGSAAACSGQTISGAARFMERILLKYGLPAT